MLLSPNDSPQRPNRQTVHYYRRLSDSNRNAMLSFYYYHIKRLNWTSFFRLPNSAAMVDYFYSTVLSLLDHFLPVTRYSKCTTDKPWVTPEFRETIKCRQKAFSQGNIAKYYRLRNRTQRMAAKLPKTYFRSKVEQLYSSDPPLGKWLKSRRILKMDDPNPLGNLIWTTRVPQHSSQKLLTCP